MKQKLQRINSKKAMLAAGVFLFSSSIAACDATEQGVEKVGSRAGEIKVGMTHTEVVSLLGQGKAGAIPIDYPIICDSWGYLDGEQSKYIHVEFMSSTPSSRVIAVTDGHAAGCVIPSIKHGSPAKNIKLGMTHLEVYAVMGPWPESFKPAAVPNWCENFAYLVGDETKYIHVLFDINGKVERVEDKQGEPCAIE